MSIIQHNICSILYHKIYLTNIILLIWTVLNSIIYCLFEPSLIVGSDKIISSSAKYASCTSHSFFNQLEVFAWAAAATISVSFILVIWNVNWYEWRIRQWPHSFIEPNELRLNTGWCYWNSRREIKIKWETCVPGRFLLLSPPNGCNVKLPMVNQT